MISINSDEAKFFDIITCNKLIEAQKTLYNNYKSNNLSKILWIRRKFLIIRMEEDNVLIAHVNKVKTLTNQLIIIEKLIDDYDIILTLFLSLLKSYNYLIIALKSIKVKELILDYIMIRLVYKVIKKNK